MDVVGIKRHFTTADGARIYDWETISVFEALKLAEPMLRCSECHGAVRLYRAAPDGSTASRAEHRKRNPGCSLDERFDGTKKMAEMAIV
jgi:hypothetical protein